MLHLQSRPSPASTAITILASALLALGFVMVLSASADLLEPPITLARLGGSSLRQASYVVLGLVTMLVAGFCPYQWWAMRRGTWRQPALILLALSLVLLGVVLIPGVGKEFKGARRWLAFGPAAEWLRFQPSELAKLAVVIALSSWCAWIGPRLRSFWTGLLPVILVLGLICVLVGKEDAGTAALLGAVGGGIILGAGARIWHLGLFSLPALCGMALLVYMADYRVARVMTFLNPGADPQGAGYHPIQSLITIASGGWWGTGLGAGIQKYDYLPEDETDFIFAVICEELGIIGGMAVIGLYALLVWQGRKAMLSAGCGLGRLIALGSTLTIGLQAAMNIAVVTVSVPTKGISLPLVSRGGSGVVFFSLLVGLLVNVARYRPAQVDTPASGRVAGRTGRPAARQDSPGEQELLLPAPA
jgi:cell division protein FtsW